MAKGEITIDEEKCKGCALCTEFCAKGCIEMSTTKFTSEGYFLAEFSHPEKCNACGICGWMCPQFAIDVYRFAEPGEKTRDRLKVKK